MKNKISSWEKLSPMFPLKARRVKWQNVGGQLIPVPVMKNFIKNIHSGKVKSWDDVHRFYKTNSELYAEQKFQHSFASLLEILKINPASFDKKKFKSLIQQTLVTKEWMVKGIYNSRAKDHHNPFRKMVYENKKEMDSVLGKLEENNFIIQQIKEMKAFRNKTRSFLKKFY
jgi:hypothetical protein